MENPMAAISFPNRACPKCGKPIHVRLKSHEACGWTANGQSDASSAAPTRRRRRKRRVRKAAASTTQAATITIDDIQAVKQIVSRLGADKVIELSRVLG